MVQFEVYLNKGTSDDIINVSHFNKGVPGKNMPDIKVPSEMVGYWPMVSFTINEHCFLVIHCL
jgi:hypothetical protein